MNPFTVLGISATAIRGLKDEQTATLVKAMHRALSLIHHPDRGGKQTKFRALQEAVEELDWDGNPEQFRYYREQLLRSPKQQLADADRDRSGAEARQRIAEEGLLDYAKAYAGVAGAPEGTQSITVLNNARVLIYETLVNTLVHRQNPVSCVLDQYQSCCELEIVAGVIHRYPAYKKVFKKDSTEEVPPHHPAWGRRDKEKRTREVWIRGKNGEQLRGARIIAAIPKDLLDGQADGPRGLTPLLVGAENAETDLPAIRNGYDWDVFRRFGSLMRPYFKEHDELICFNDGRFMPIGRIRGICPIGDWPTE